MRPTHIGSLAALLVGVAALVWGVFRVAESRGTALPDLTWTAPGGVAVLAVVVLVTTIALRSRLRGDRPPHPLGIARMAVLGKASAHVGPIVGGFYLGYLVLLLEGLEVTSRRERAVLSGFALLASVVLTAAGLWLERTCRVRRGEPNSADVHLHADPYDD